MFRKVVVPLDGTLQAEQVLAYVRQITIPDRTEIVLVCNLAELSESYTSTASTAPGTIADHLYGPIQVYLNQREEELQRLGYGTHIQLVKDGTAAEIARVAAEMHADLIAMATHGRSPIGRWLLGSVADQVLHDTLHPVLLARAGIGSPVHQQIQRILVPLDGSALSEQALPVARMLAGELGASILLAQAAPSPGILAKGGPFPAHDAAGAEAGEELSAIEGYLQRQQTKLWLSNVQCEQEVLIEEPAQAIVVATKEGECDLIVMATHARTGLDRYLHGSIAGNVLYDSACPLLLVRGAVREHASQLSGMKNPAPA